MRIFIVACLLMLEQRYDVIKNASTVFILMTIAGVFVAILQDVREFLPKIVEDRRK